MTPRKLNVLIACFSYGGNGGLSSEHPDVRNWLLLTVPKIMADKRVGECNLIDIADTPITMSRNKSVMKARAYGADILIMVDSDQRPDMYLGEMPNAKPFWESSFNAIYDHYDKGPLAIGAPYCGPPPEENVYVFRWRNKQSKNPDPVDAQLDQFTREEASEQGGIKSVAALPTGLIMFDMRLFEVVDPIKQYNKLIEKGYSSKDAKLLTQPWFYYEWDDIYAAGKASTEDVTATRDMSLIGIQALGYNPIKCNWDSWAGHWKPKCVGMPIQLTEDEVSERYAIAANTMSRQTKSIAWKSPEITHIDFASADVIYAQ